MKCTHKPIRVALVSRKLGDAIWADVPLKTIQLSIEVFDTFKEKVFVDADYLNKFGFTNTEIIVLSEEEGKEFEFYSGLIPNCMECISAYLNWTASLSEL